MKNKKHTGLIGWIIVAFMSIMQVIPAANAISREPYYQEMKDAGNPTADAGLIASQTNQQQSTLEALLDLFDINYAGDGKALKYVQVVINYVISFAAFVALIVIIYGFYMMFFRDQDKWFGSAKKTITGAALALFVIAISWIFVNFAFYVFNRGL